jgi:uncharacterized protein (TIGR00369 family)
VALQIPPNCDLTLGLTCLDKTEAGISVWSMRVDDRFLNPAGVVQGGFLAAMADSAMGASAVTAARDAKVAVASTEMKISYLRPVVRGATLTCRARVLKRGSAITFVEARIVDDDDQVVATASSTYLVRERPE